MTREEAIDMLRHCEAERHCYDGIHGTCKGCNKRIALDMAIEALSADAVQGWIPCYERLPEAEDMYQPPDQRYLCQLEAYGERKFCVLSRLKGAISPFWDWYGVAVHDSEVTAWMPLPEPYKERRTDE